MQRRADSPVRNVGWATLAFVLASAVSPVPEDPAGGGQGERRLEELSLEELLRLPVYAPTKLAERVEEATGSVSLITRSLIESYGWLSLNEVLYTLPGFTPSAQFERRTVGARGLYGPWGNNELLVLFDGVSHNDPVTGSAYTWEITPLFLAEAIEVVRGPGASLYGPNAMQGVVAIRSVSAGEDPFTRGDIRLGTFGRRIYEVMGGARTPLVSMVLGFNRDEFRGENRPSYDLSGRRDAGGNLRQFATFEGRNSSYFLAKLEGRGQLQGWGLQLHNQTWDYGAGLGYIHLIPDVPDSFQESRQLLTATYRTPSEDAVWQHEYVLRLQRHHYLWDVRLVPGDVFPSHPGGITEDLAYHVDELFGRAQLSLGGEGFGRVIGGAEYSLLLYNGDEAHHINADLAGELINGFPPSLPGPVTVGPFLEGMRGRPLHRIGLFAEWVSRAFLNEVISLTAGLRYDNRFFEFLDVFTEDRPVRFSSFQQLSPRLTVRAIPIAPLTVRATVGWAFRDPAADELFASNSLLALGGVGRLQPESNTSYELGLAYQLTKALRAQATGFLLRFRDQLGYSSEGITRNLYSRDTAGLEAELLLGTGPGRYGNLSGFANSAWVHLLEETVSDPAFTSQQDRLTWAPSHTAKVGLSYAYGRFSLSLQGRYQGRVFRKDSDLINPENRTLRPDLLPDWLTLDATAGFEVASELTLRAKGTNLFDVQGRLVKIQDAPFDYLIEGRQLWAGVELRL
jgi:outer membrane receptor protein involved in Fe transport